jgi:hypothetical protein
MPGGHATFGKVFYINPDKRKETFYSILIEKFILTWVILFFATWANVIVFGKWLIPSVIFAIIISFLPFVAPLIFRRYVSIDFLENYYLSLPKILMSQVTFVILTFVQYYVLINSIGNINVSFINLSTTVALILVANIIPITFSGLGLRETASALLLPRLGVPVEVAVGASLIIFLFNAVVPAIPGLWYLREKNI